MPKWWIVCMGILWMHVGVAQSLHPDRIDPEILNKHIINEVNKLRKKAKVDPLANNDHLLDAANDQAQFMKRKERVTHFQIFNGKKRSPKNRIDYYGGGFDAVGENCQLTNPNWGSAIDDEKHPRVTSYEELAAKMVLQWKNSPPHYANMISPNFKHTYTAAVLGENGEVYGCQVFGGPEYQDKHKDKNPELNYKPERPRKCKPCAKRPPAGVVKVSEDGIITFEYQTKMKFHLFHSRMRLYNPWRDGLAADIVLKSQYPCDTFSNFNGRLGVRGIPLEPVYKKDYMWIGLRKTNVVLGRVPDYIDEDFEVNLTVINKKRTCTNTQYWVIPSEFHVDIPLDFGVYPDSSVMVEYRMDTIQQRLYFDKSEILPQDSTRFAETLQLLQDRSPFLTGIQVKGFASIEGSTQNNIELYNNRAAYLTKQLYKAGLDSSSIVVSAQENFTDFRSDVQGTSFEYLAELSDRELKEQVQNRSLSDSLERFLKNHRFVSIEGTFREGYNVEYTPEIVLEGMRQAVSSGKLGELEKLQRIQYRFALEGSIPPDHIDSVHFPIEKRYLKPIHNQLVMRFLLDSLTEESVDTLHNRLVRMLPLKPTDKKLNTSIAILRYYKEGWIPEDYFKFNKKNIEPFYDTLRKSSYVDAKIRSKILLNMASYADWVYYHKTGSRKERKYFHKQAQKQVKPARLDVDKTFEIATYYSFFGNHKYAYELTRKRIDETENPNDLIFFLKLIHLNDIKLPRKKYVKYFKKIREYSGEEFCTYFNNPALNFQILDDEEIKEIWCEECAGKIKN